MSNIQYERFYIPIGLAETGKIDGQSLFSSLQTKTKFLSSIQESKEISRIYPVISQYVKDNIIIPAYVHSGIFSRLLNKTFANKISSELLGLYLPEQNKIYILVDSGSNFFWKSDLGLSQVTFHELMHYASANNRKKFSSAFKRPLLEYYQLFFKRCANIEVSPNNIWKLLEFMFNTFENRKSKKQTDLDKLESFYSRYICKDKSKLQNILVPLYTYIYKPDLFFNSINIDLKINKTVSSLYLCYSDVFGIIKPNTTPIQELLYPSEVIAVSSSRPTAQHYLVF
jgi:hypothetical protein